METGDLLDRGIRAVQAGERRRGRALLTEALKQNPRAARSWIWLAACMDDPQQQRFCLQKAQELEPNNAQIRRALERLESNPAAAGENSEQQEAPGPTDQAASEPPAAVTDIPVAAIDDGDQPPAIPGTTIPVTGAARRPRSCLAALLVLAVAAAAVAALLLILPGMTGQSVDWSRLSAQFRFLPSNTGPLAAVPAAPATLALPVAPTWTPERLSPPEPTVTLRPTLDWSKLEATAPILLPSITPLSGYSRLIIGRSVENRAIEVYRFGRGRRERMIIAGIHGGDEYNTIALADALIEHLAQNPDLVPEGFSLYILRALNPDGAAAGREPENRLNANGVDLNRNFDTNWKATWRSENCASAPGTAGSAPGSEPETRAVKDFLRGRKIEALIVYHSAWLGVFPSGDPPHPDSVRLAQAIAEVSKYAYPPMKTGCEYTGTLVDWAANSGIPAAVDLELNSETEIEFEDNLKVLELLLNFDVQRTLPTPPTVDPALLFTPTRPRSTPTPESTSPTASTSVTP